MNLLAAALLVTTSCSGDDVSSPPELGRVSWSRDLESAYALSRKSQRPVMVLFQEVPG